MSEWQTWLAGILGSAGLMGFLGTWLNLHYKRQSGKDQRFDDFTARIDQRSKEIEDKLRDCEERCMNCEREHAVTSGELIKAQAEIDVLQAQMTLVETAKQVAEDNAARLERLEEKVDKL